MHSVPDLSVRVPVVQRTCASDIDSRKAALRTLRPSFCGSGTRSVPLLDRFCQLADLASTLAPVDDDPAEKPAEDRVREILLRQHESGRRKFEPVIFQMV